MRRINKALAPARFATRLPDSEPALPDRTPALPNRELRLPNREPDLPNRPLFCPVPESISILYVACCNS